MANLERPTCKTCWFSKAVEVLIFDLSGTLVKKDRYCLKEPESVLKSDDDFCQYHPLWDEFESNSMPGLLSQYYATATPDT